MRRKYIAYNLAMAILSIVIAIILILELTLDLSYQIRLVFQIIDFIVWSIFVIDYFTRLYKSKNKKKFFKKNLIDLISIIPLYSIFKVFRALDILKVGRVTRVSEITRVIRLLAIIKRTNNELSEFMKTNNFNYTIGIAIIIVLISATVMSSVENMSLGAALWWSIVTFTTVGYGDVYPISTLGKLTASILMIMGIGFIGSVTSTLSTYFIKKEVRKRKAEMIKKNSKLIKKSLGKSKIIYTDNVIYSKENYKNELIKDIVKRLSKFDDLSKEEINTMCKVLLSLK
ncbi:MULTISPECIES: potassium channel family protein [Romboutsia]|nr:MULTISPECIES: potassium channel family protein [Romboutsia]MCH1960660.1 potassium channel family protein [Romboutsia hominis]MCH1968908.1 potassium channel family protein [Romboutsia hominis]MDB8794969.1 ion channel [Romboutsia sp. 1001216sp1]MDB8798780.1 ion channel [Romboutsia sp. 1001216sp1]MDB8804213.1 ion channel [Romboutsia sp. 1001216sp1]